ncbi:hypothetical protein ACO0LL_04400 [Undibacterium sp. TC4M20W]|uniref:hypothetical protein n=1 Tax=Undibacterium sp. TC4M20W TaxID=3413052 RepID=UPI003BF0FFF8
MRIRMTISNRLSQFFMPKSPLVLTPALRSSIAAGTDYYSLENPEFYEIFLDWRTGVSVSDEQISSLSVLTAERHLHHRNGYVREFCLRVLIAHERFPAFRIIIARLNDYATEVRDLAEATVHDWINILPAEDIIAALPDIYALQKQSRSNAQQVMEQVLARLAAPQCHALILEGISSRDHKIRALCWQLALNVFHWGPMEKIVRAIDSMDTLLGQFVSADVINLTDSEVLELYARWTNIKVMQLRRSILLVVKRRQLRPEDELFVLALWDNSYTIRNLARGWAGAQAKKLTAEYQHMLANTSSIRKKLFALEGIRLQKSAAMLDVCLGLLRDENAGIRKSALLTLCKINPEKLPEYVHDCIYDPSIIVVKECMKICITTGDLLQFPALEQVAKNRKTELIFFRQIIEYATHTIPWHGLHIVSLTELADQRVQTAIQQSLRSFLAHWSRRVIYGNPTPLQFKTISSWLSNEKLDAMGRSGSELRFIFDAEVNRQTKLAKDI